MFYYYYYYYYHYFVQAYRGTTPNSANGVQRPTPDRPAASLNTSSATVTPQTLQTPNTSYNTAYTTKTPNSQNTTRTTDHSVSGAASSTGNGRWVVDERMCQDCTFLLCASLFLLIVMVCWTFN